MYVLYLEHISVCSSVFLELNSLLLVVTSVMDRIGLEIKMNGFEFVIIDKYLLGIYFAPDTVLGMQQGINVRGIILMEL